MNAVRLKSIIVIIFCSVQLSSCGGWTKNQEETWRNTLKANFKEHFEKNGLEADQAVLNKWADCVVEKSKHKYANWKDFVEHQKDPIVKQYMDDCGATIGLGLKKKE